MARALGAWVVACGVATLGFVGCGGTDHSTKQGDAGADAGGASAGESTSTAAGGGAEAHGGAAGAETTGGTSAGGSPSPSAGESNGAGSGGDGGAATVPMPALPGDAVFTRDGFLDVRLTLDEAVWRDLEEHGDLEEYVEASAEVSRSGGPSAAFGKLGVRHKGAYSLHHCWDEFGGVRSYAGVCAKLSYKLSFDKYEKDSAFDGLKRLNLHAASGDASKLRELVAYQAFRDAGIETARAIPARLYINDQPQGVFIAVEDIDEQFLAAHYPGAADGNLYKEIWPNSAFTDDDFTGALETNSKSPNVDDMRAFANSIEFADADSFAHDIGKHTELTRLLRYVAVDRLLRNWDGITAFYSPLTPHNFFWYRDSGAESRFHLIPWDMDNTLWEFDPYMHPEQWVTVPPVPDINSKPLDCTPRVVWRPDSGTYITPPRCDKLLDLLMRTQLEDFQAVAKALQKTALDPARMQATANHYANILAPLIANDPFVDSVAWQNAISALSFIIDDAAADFDDFVTAGLIEEQAPPPDPDAPTQEELDAVTPDEGLHLDGITNFEFSTAPDPAVPTGVYLVGDTLSAYSAAWSKLSPLSGTADLRFDFTFNRGPEAYDEWVDLMLFGAEADVSQRTRLVVRLSSDKPRQVRIRVASPAYDDTFGGVWQEFGTERLVGPTPTDFSIDFSSLYYPTWARDGWDDKMGFPDGDDAAKAVVLSRMNGVIFAPAATVDGAGELLTTTEAGWLRVDNIYLR